MTKFVLTKQAQADIEEISDYISEKNIKGAIAVGAAIQKTCTLISDMPEIGHVVKPIGNELRQIIVSKYPNYAVFYIVTHGTPVIVRVLHGKRNIPTLLHEWYGSKE